MTTMPRSRSTDGESIPTYGESNKDVRVCVCVYAYSPLLCMVYVRACMSMRRCRVVAPTAGSACLAAVEAKSENFERTTRTQFKIYALSDDQTECGKKNNNTAAAGGRGSRRPLKGERSGGGRRPWKRKADGLSDAAGRPEPLRKSMCVQIWPHMRDHLRKILDFVRTVPTTNCFLRNFLQNCSC